MPETRLTAELREATVDHDTTERRRARLSWGPKHSHEILGGVLRLKIVVFTADEMNRAVGLKVLDVGDILSVDPHNTTGCVRDFDPSHLASRGPKAKYPGRDSNS